MSVLPVILLVLLGGCGTSSKSGTLPTTSMKLGNGNFVIEIANTDPTRMTGLMNRDSMPSNHGMIFVFNDEQPREFYMKNTRYPLDIVFLSTSGNVVSIRQMKAYDLTSIPSDYAAKYAIELNLGVAQSAGIKVGDAVRIPQEAREPVN